MATDLATTDATDGQRALAWKALSLLTCPIERAAAELGDGAAAAIDAAVAHTERELRSVPAGGPDRAEWAKALDERLRRLGAKVLPTAREAADTWREAMAEALSDLPAMVALTAAKQAIHRPFRFIGEVEPAIREIAAEMVSRREGRLLRLEQLRRAIAAELRPPATLPRTDEFRPVGVEQMPEPIRRLGLKLGYLVADDDGIRETSA